jgi:hypothetical protein
MKNEISVKNSLYNRPTIDFEDPWYGRRVTAHINSLPFTVILFNVSIVESMYFGEKFKKSSKADQSRYIWRVES